MNKQEISHIINLLAGIFCLLILLLYSIIIGISGIIINNLSINPFFKISLIILFMLYMLLKILKIKKYYNLLSYTNLNTKEVKK